jgi:endonuclease/exonuclease/phosphatase family metal-dependent hydrolase
MRLHRKLLIVWALVVVICIFFGFQLLQSKATAKAVPKNDVKVASLKSVQSNDSCKKLFVSWNMKDMGKSKSQESLEVMASVLKDADVVAIQEVVAGKGFGAKKVADLAQVLAQKGQLFDNIVSNPTFPDSPGVERYGYLIRKHILFSRDDTHLVKALQETIDREPYALTAKWKDETTVTFFTIHTVPTKKKPELEVAVLPSSDEVKNVSPAIFAGDFNLPARSTDPVFTQMGYTGQIREKTSIKDKLDAQGGYLLHQYDNIYTKGIHVCESGVIDFVDQYFSPVRQESLRKAREVSDHLPVYIRFK